MKKIGIMTMQRIRNYGSFLQAYALKKTIESLGYNVDFVDYKFEKSLINDNRKIIKLLNKVKKHINIYQLIKRKKFTKKFNNTYDNDFLPMLNISKLNYNPNIDTLVIGSDEVFNCLQSFPVGYSRNLFGYEYEKNKLISYAASFGFTNIKDLKKYNVEKEISNMLKNFSSISVRDNNSFNIVKELTNIDSTINVDPVLIYDFPANLREIDIKNYIIVYAYTERLSREEEKYIKNFAKKYNKKILSLGSYQRIADYMKIVNPLDILSYFKNADFVITDTFHGSVFSMKTNTKFCTIIRNSNYNKLSDLLNRLDKSSQIVNNIEEIEMKYKEKIDFKNTNRIMEKERKKAIEFLKNNL